MAFIDTAFDGEIVSPEQWVVLAYVVDIQLKPNDSTRKALLFLFLMTRMVVSGQGGITETANRASVFKNSKIA